MNTAEAVGEVRKFGRFIKAFEHLEAVADQLAKADTLLEERAKALASTEVTITEAEAKIQELGAQLLDQSEKFAEGVEVAQASNDELLREATVKAAEIYSDAKLALDQYNEQGQEAAIQLRDLKAKITSTQVEYDELWPKLATARDQARQILEGST